MHDRDIKIARDIENNYQGNSQLTFCPLCAWPNNDSRNKTINTMKT